MKGRHLLGAVLIVALAIQATRLLDPTSDQEDAKVRLAGDRTAAPSATGTPAADMRVVSVQPLSKAVETPATAKTPPKTATGSNAPPGRKRATSASAPRSGELPALALDYDTIGFTRYVALAERIGRFYLLLDDHQIGPGVSLKRRRLLDADFEGLVTDRPYLVRDPEVSERLPSDLPEAAHTDRVVLFLYPWADRAVWAAVRRAVAAHDVAMARVTKVTGRYGKGATGAYIRLETAVVSNGESTVALDETIRLR